MGIGETLEPKGLQTIIPFFFSLMINRTYLKIGIVLSEFSQQ